MMGRASAGPDAEWWTTSDVAAYLGVQIGTVSAYRSRGQVSAPTRTSGGPTCGGRLRVVGAGQLARTASSEQPGAAGCTHTGQDEDHHEEGSRSRAGPDVPGLLAPAAARVPASSGPGPGPVPGPCPYLLRPPGPGPPRLLARDHVRRGRRVAPLGPARRLDGCTRRGTAGTVGSLSRGRRGRLRGRPRARVTARGAAQASASVMAPRSASGSVTGPASGSVTRSASGSVTGTARKA